jgi:hypothetical protein
VNLHIEISFISDDVRKSSSRPVATAPRQPSHSKHGGNDSTLHHQSPGPVACSRIVHNNSTVPAAAAAAAAAGDHPSARSGSGDTDNIEEEVQV